MDGPTTFVDDFGDPRSGGRTHQGVDIHAPKMTPLVAAVDGTVSWLTETEQSYGWMLELRDSEGWEYWYIHINNDTPGTDDGMGGRQYAFAPGIDVGSRVTKGELIAWVGDSGDAEEVGPHLHFEIHPPGHGAGAIDPYPSLIAAAHPDAYDVKAALAASPTINDDKGLTANPFGTASSCVSGSLIRSASNPAVYYCGADGKRYVFPNARVYDSWYKDFSTVQTVTDAQLASAMLGGNVTYRPGSKLVKIQSDPKVYAVATGGVLRYVTTPAIAASLYGTSWNKQVDDVSDAFFVNYKTGPAITAVN